MGMNIIPEETLDLGFDEADTEDLEIDTDQMILDHWDAKRGIAGE